MMSTVTEKVSTVGRKKRLIPARTLKLDGDIVGMAEMLARPLGMTTADYLSAILRPIIEKEWSKELRKKAGEGSK
ncbi:MAG TPA: hypothetical protein VJY33_24520 [Isosphaeraceae bacterium]|nr:hypothetical protein [Isosphaeraceae bacterium]